MWKYKYVYPCNTIYPGYRFKSDDVGFIQKVWKIDTIGYFSKCKYSDKIFLCTADRTCSKDELLIVRRYRCYEIGVDCSKCPIRCSNVEI